MPSKTEICNMALSHIGTAMKITNIDTDKSQEAKSCRTFFETSRDATLRDYNWPFATTYKNLGLIKDLRAEPDEFISQEWSFVYEYPSDCLKARRVLSGIRTDSRQTLISYKLLEFDQKISIYCDVENAALEYTKLISDPVLYPADFIIALSYRLSSYIAPQLTKGDPFQMKANLMNLYNIELSRAQATSLNEEQPDEEVYSEFERGR